MSHFRIGEIEKANEYRAKLDAAMKMDAFKEDEECLSFLAEVSDLFAMKKDVNSGSND